MANNFDKGYASKYTGELDKMIVQTSKTGFFADNALKAKFSGSKTVYLSELNLEGMGNYSRTEGYSKGDTTLVHTPYTLTKERSKQLFMDAQDADESGVADLIGKLVGEFTRTQVVPEVDAYNLSVLYQVAADVTDGKVSTAVDYDSANAVSQFLSVINSAEAAMEYDGSTSLVAFVSPTLYNILQTSTELQRHIIVSDFKQGEINLKVKNLNGCSIIPVAASRMKSKFEFGDNGFTAVGAKDVHAIILPKDSASFVKKVDKVNVLSPDQVEDYDAYKINFRMYYDLIVKNSRKKTIFAIA